ncbi:MAG: hypothetical protein DWQ30_18680 [Acidobacteria bacterium]|nr:MAG: hypothetical protein DWQ30_18680 [Acidobacteriota bacterium]
MRINRRPWLDAGPTSGGPWTTMLRSLTAVALLVAGCGGGGGCGGAADPGLLLGGIQVNEPDMSAWHRELLRQGMNTVSLTVYARQQLWDSADLIFDPDQLGDDVVREMRAARSVGLHTVLVLRLALDQSLEGNRFLWHGMVSPRDAVELDAWFHRYSRFVLEWAVVAEREGVEALAIGSELAALTNTVRIDRLPDLESYYLDEALRREEHSRLLASGDARLRSALSGTESDAEGPIGGSAAAEVLSAEVAAHAAWARQVTGGADLAFVNGRREHLERNWRRLIEDVRRVYSGRLTYAANFDQVEQVAFWDALDLIGVNAYYPLRETLAPAEPNAVAGNPLLRDDFADRWRGILMGLDQLRVRLARPQMQVLVTELGYTGRRGSTVQPWAGEGVALLPAGDGGSAAERPVVWQAQPEAPWERAAAIEALGIAAREIAPPLLAGVLYWKLSTLPRHREIEPFVVVLGDQPPDPAVAALRSLASGRLTVADGANEDRGAGRPALAGGGSR